MDCMLPSHCPSARLPDSLKWCSKAQLLKGIGMRLVGPGIVAAQHPQAVRQLQGVAFIAIVDSTSGSASLKAKQLGVSKGYGSYYDFLFSSRYGSLHNTTSNHIRFSIIVTALEAQHMLFPTSSL